MSFESELFTSAAVAAPVVAVPEPAKPGKSATVAERAAWMRRGKGKSGKECPSPALPKVIPVPVPGEMVYVGDRFVKWVSAKQYLLLNHEFKQLKGLNKRLIMRALRAERRLEVSLRWLAEYRAKESP